MVLYDPMERPLLQLVTSHPATNKKLFPRRAPAWANDITKLSDAQLRSCQAFGQYAMSQLRGVTGTEMYEGKRISSTAAKVARDYPSTGRGIFGGLTAEERRQQSYAESERTMQRLNDELRARGVSTGSQRVTGGGAVADGGVNVTPEGN